MNIGLAGPMNADYTPKNLSPHTNMISILHEPNQSPDIAPYKSNRLTLTPTLVAGLLLIAPHITTIADAVPQRRDETLGTGTFLKTTPIEITATRNSLVSDLFDFTVKSYIRESSAALTKDDSPPADVRCSIKFFLKNDTVDVFTDPLLADHSTPFQVAGLNAMTQHRVKIVRRITWCNETAQPGRTFLACSDPGSSIVIGAVTSYRNPSLIAHEYGHNKGLCDVGKNCETWLGSDSRRVMYHDGGPPHRYNIVTGTECLQFKQ